MAYNLEELGDERFQQLCQAVLTRAFPDLQCLPVGQPDGGRDAFVRHRVRTRVADCLIYQVKFVRDPNSRDAHDSSHCWWRDDIERRIDTFSDIKWSYPDMIRATDLLLLLLQNHSNDKEMDRRIEVIRAYLAHQYNIDSQLKFKQIDLQTNILDIFVDVPAQIVLPTNEEAQARLKDALLPRLYYLLRNRSVNSSSLDDSEAPGAAFLLADPDVARAFPRIVIEGAPGQGKSTVTQYVCQIQRMMLLGRSELHRVPKKQSPTQARIPFRVDLRDYATWLAGRDPFSDDQATPLPPNITPLLESFLAAQVHRYTARSFTVDDLAAVARSSQLLIMLDGFDEVADIPTRNRARSRDFRRGHPPRGQREITSSSRYQPTRRLCKLARFLPRRMAAHRNPGTLTSCHRQLHQKVARSSLCGGS
jgi:hypothetical protein